MEKRVLLALVLALGLAAPAAAAEDTIGVVGTVAGAAGIVRGDRTIPAAVGLRLREGDTLKTASGASIGVTFHDDSTLSLGPDSSVVISRFLFAPAQGNMEFLCRIVRGTVAYVSGLIGKLAPEKARFETPVASIGIRGTRFAVKIDE